MAKHDFLKSSLAQLNAVTNEAYNEDIRQAALNLWGKHLQPKNPQWKFITAKPFYLKNKSGSAHVMAMVDKRLPEIGIVGYFACTNSAVGAQVLNQAASWLKEEFSLKDIYGPINGTLPSDYRLNLKDNFCFPGEPVNPTWHMDAFREAGFKVFNRYVSGISKHYQLLMKLVIRKPKKGYEHLTVRGFDTKRLKQDFKKYHDLRNAIFPFQSIYCPAISLEERVYNSSGKFDPNYTCFLVDNKREVGFIMAYAYEGQLILKSIGLLPEYRGKGLVGLLLKPVHDQASKQGLKTAVYGMVRVGNAAYRMKRPGVRIFRKYVTMHKNV
jgi:ribosomal protein S18 acetylase RimI-like enzyme